MKVLAINSSPRPEGQSKTALLLEHLVKGMRDAGAEVEVVDLRRKKIKLCTGCYSCWTKTPGICVHKDDMTAELFDQWMDSDLAVYATPLYHYTLNAAMKAFIERTIPMAEPFLVREGGITHHPLRGRRPPDAVVLSVCGFPEMEHFEQLSAYCRRLFGELLLAEIYRPGAEILTHAGAKRKPILEAIETAGRELVESGGISPDTLAAIAQDVVDPGLMAEVANLMWRTCIAEGVTPREFDEKGLIPKAETLEEFMTIMRYVFNPDGALGADVVLQFDFSGSVEGPCQLKITDGTIETAVGTPYDPSLVITTPFELWADIMAGNEDPAQMFMEQKVTAEGDFEILTRFARWFS